MDKIMEDNFSNLIEQSKSVLILLPTKPFFDQVAAGLSLYLFLREKKDVSISSTSPMTVELNRLVGVNKISQDLGNKNLLIRFLDYKATNIERVSADVEGGNFTLKVIPKPSVQPPAKDQLEFSYAGVKSDTVILVGGVNESHFPALSSNELSGTKIIHVGNRGINIPSKAGIMSLARSAASTCEVVYSLIKESGADYDVDIATNLLMGIEEATDKFSTPEVSAETFEIIAELIRKGGKRNVAIRQRKGFYPPGSIPGRVVQKQDSDQAKEKTPKDWLEPKIYKGTSIS